MCEQRNVPKIHSACQSVLRIATIVSAGEGSIRVKITVAQHDPELTAFPDAPNLQSLCERENEDRRIEDEYRAPCESQI